MIRARGAIWLLPILAITVACRPSQVIEPTRGSSPVVTITDQPTTLPTVPSTVEPTATLTSVTDTPDHAQAQTVTPEPPLNTLLFVGNIVPARCVQAKIDETANPNYPYEEVRDLIREVDIAVGTLNATLSDYTTMTGCVETFLLVGRSDNADALAWAGFDMMSVATNHIKNCGLSACGDRAFLDTLENLQRVGITPVGAGHNLAEALQPQVIESRGVRFAFVSLGEIEASTFATQDTPGIASLTEANLRAALAAAREVGDVVIALPHWGPEYSPDPNYSELNFAQIAVDSGADIVVGNHTHVVQAVQTIGDIPVFYGLGNFMFDQTLQLEAQQGVILLITFQGTRLVGHTLIPVHIDSDGRVHIAESNEAVAILARIEAASQRLPP